MIMPICQLIQLNESEAKRASTLTLCRYRNCHLKICEREPSFVRPELNGIGVGMRQEQGVLEKYKCI